ncbi:CDP-diacylglycerol diphosphatase [Stenotrophomonas rhizophila]|uniref:CDP-diacylglycerol diphosphatase n=1 Tax=Stenotrophomonas rhizophila TaxID=216778 RepID=UPI001E3D18EB|nr:CDP-diacylglycerol diphosphatase [Stenotrophomonas rhizophila]
MPALRLLLCSLPLLLAACATSPAQAPAAKRPVNPDALWGLIQRDCVGAGTPRGDCLAVAAEPGRRDVLLKDAHGRFQFLLLPLDRISGIESPALLRADAPNYFAAAWEARWRTGRALGRPLPREVASLALNSPQGRSQHQLHIHVDCLRADVLAQLQRMGGAIGSQWQPLPEPLRGHRYQARRLRGAQLQDNPVQLLATELAGAADLRNWSLVVSGSRQPDGTPGFLLLATRVDAASGNQASGEELQDHACAVVTGAGGPLDGVR